SHPLVEARKRTQYDHRRRLTEASDRGEDREPVDAAWEHAIEDDDVPPLVRGEGEPARTVAHQSGCGAGLLEALADITRGVRFILYNETTHPGAIRCSRTTRRNAYSLTCANAAPDSSLSTRNCYGFL